MNRNGKKTNRFFCKMSDMKILKGRIGKNKSLYKFTCYTTRGSNTIDYAIASTDVFPKFSDFYIDIMDSCMSIALYAYCCHVKSHTKKIQI